MRSSIRCSYICTVPDLVTTRRLWRAAAFAVLLTAVVVHAALALGSSAPACALPALDGAAWFSSVSAVKIGVKIGLVMFDPLMPKNQKMP